MDKLTSKKLSQNKRNKKNKRNKSEDLDQEDDLKSPEETSNNEKQNSPEMKDEMDGPILRRPIKKVIHKEEPNLRESKTKQNNEPKESNSNKSKKGTQKIEIDESNKWIVLLRQFAKDESKLELEFPSDLTNGERKQLREK